MMMMGEVEWCCNALHTTLNSMTLPNQQRLWSDSAILGSEHITTPNSNCITSSFGKRKKVKWPGWWERGRKDAKHDGIHTVRSVLARSRCFKCWKINTRPIRVSERHFGHTVQGMNVMRMTSSLLFLSHNSEVPSVTAWGPNQVCSDDWIPEFYIRLSEVTTDLSTIKLEETIRLMLNPQTWPSRKIQQFGCAGSSAIL